MVSDQPVSPTLLQHPSFLFQILSAPPPPLLFLTLGNLLISFSPSFRWLACRRLSKDNEFETSLVCPHAGSALLHTFSQAASQKGRTTSVASSVFCHIFSERQKKKKVVVSSLSGDVGAALLFLMTWPSTAPRIRKESSCIILGIG